MAIFLRHPRTGVRHFLRDYSRKILTHYHYYHEHSIVNTTSQTRIPHSTVGAASICTGYSFVVIILIATAAASLRLLRLHSGCDSVVRRLDTGTLAK